MKHRLLLVVLGASIVLLALGFLAGKAYAATSCFTDTAGHWAETYICWLWENEIAKGFPDGSYQPESAIKRSEMAVMLMRQADVPPTKGFIAIGESHANWKPPSSASSLVFAMSAPYSIVYKSAAGGDIISLHPSIPTVLYGHSLQFLGVEFCFSANDNVYLSNFEVNVPTHTSSPNDQGQKLSDPTDYKVPACHYYVLSAPVILNADNAINVYVTIQWVSSSYGFGVGRTTFFFLPTGIHAAQPSGMENPSEPEEGVIPLVP